jgi:hypothetical protein
MQTKEKTVSGREYMRDTRAPGKQRIKKCLHGNKQTENGL